MDIYVKHLWDDRIFLMDLSELLMGLSNFFHCLIIGWKILGSSVLLIGLSVRSFIELSEHLLGLLVDQFIGSSEHFFLGYQ